MLQQHFDATFADYDETFDVDLIGDVQTLHKTEETNNEPPANTAMHPMVYKIMIGFFAIMMTSYTLKFWGDAYALFMVAISAFYMVMYLGVPIAMNKMGAFDNPNEKSFHAFLREPFDTHTGKITGFEAALQACLIPAAATICVIGFCLI